MLTHPSTKYAGTMPGFQDLALTIFSKRSSKHYSNTASSCWNPPLRARSNIVVRSSIVFDWRRPHVSPNATVYTVSFQGHILGMNVFWRGHCCVYFERMPAEAATNQKSTRGCAFLLSGTCQGLRPYAVAIMRHFRPKSSRRSREGGAPQPVLAIVGSQNWGYDNYPTG